MKKGILYTDGGARGNPGPAGFGALLFDENNLLLSSTEGILHMLQITMPNILHFLLV